MLTVTPLDHYVQSRTLPTLSKGAEVGVLVFRAVAVWGFGIAVFVILSPLWRSW